MTEHTCSYPISGKIEDQGMSMVKLDKREHGRHINILDPNAEMRNGIQRRLVREGVKKE